MVGQGDESVFSSDSESEKDENIAQNLRHVLHAEAETEVKSRLDLNYPTYNISSTKEHEPFIFLKQSILISRRKLHIAKGSCPDFGAELTVIRLHQANTYCNFIGMMTLLKPIRRQYKFVDDKRKFMGSINI